MRLRFTIRDLLWLTVVVALAVGWWLDHAKLPERWRWRYVPREVPADTQMGPIADQPSRGPIPQIH